MFSNGCDKMSELVLEVLALALSVFLGIAAIYSIRLYLEI